MASTEHEQRNRPPSLSSAAHSAGGTTTEADLLSIQRDFPAFRIWREITGDRIRFVAHRRHPSIRLHTVVTADLHELRVVLADSSPRMLRVEPDAAP